MIYFRILLDRMYYVVVSELNELDYIQPRTIVLTVRTILVKYDI